MPATYCFWGTKAVKACSQSASTRRWQQDEATIRTMSLQPMIRDVRPEDAARLAELWIEVGAYYEAIDPDEFQTPRGADLMEWMEDDISGDRSDDELWVVADRDGSPVGY